MIPDHVVINENNIHKIIGIFLKLGSSLNMQRNVNEWDIQLKQCILKK